MEEKKLIKGHSTYNIVLSEKISHDIRYTCRSLESEEWSGVLFYRLSGNFYNSSVEITADDFFLMDIGNSVSTEFNMSVEVSEYMAIHPELLDCQLGLIHSHNNMSAFFSKVDMDTLREEGTDKPHFVSLIVNNTGPYVASIVHRAKLVRDITDSLIYESSSNIISIKTFQVTTEILECNNLNVIYNDSEQIVNHELVNRINDLKVRRENERRKLEHRFCPESISEELPLYGKHHKTKSDKYCLASQTLKTLLVQLLTGDITVTETSRININFLLNRMTSVFDNRFKEEEDFIEWATYYVEFLCNHTRDKTGELEDASVCAESLIKSFNVLPKNKYISIYLEILEEYINGY